MIGDNIKKIRELKRISKQELADATGYSFAYISMLENNKRENPSMKTLQKIANALKVSVDELLNDGADEELPDLENEDTAEMKLLFDKIRDIPPSEQKRIIAIIRAFMEETSN